MLFSIDRFENDLAVLIDENGEFRTVFRRNLPQNINEGDLLRYDGTVYSLEQKKTEERRKEVASLIDELFN